MGKLIQANADSTRIVEHVRTSYLRATAMADPVAAAAKERLGEALAAVDAASAA